MNSNQDRPFNYREAFDRNIGWLSTEEQECLRTSCVAVAGLGGAGGYQADALARLGVGRFKIADPDTFEISNVNRQVGALKDTLGRPKTEVICDRILSINPEAKVDVFPSRITRENIDTFLDGVDVVIDGIDYFEQEAKLALFQKSRERQLTAITSCPLGFGASVISFAPDGMRYEDYFDLQEDMTEIEKKFALSFGLSPSLLCLKYIQPKAISFETRRAASVAPGLMLVGALTASEAVKILTGRNPVCYSPHIYQIDLLTYQVRHKYYRWGMKSPWLRLKRRLVFMFLSGGFRKVPWMTLPQAT